MRAYHYIALCPGAGIVRFDLKFKGRAEAPVWSRPARLHGCTVILFNQTDFKVCEVRWFNCHGPAPPECTKTDLQACRLAEVSGAKPHVCCATLSSSNMACPGRVGQVDFPAGQCVVQANVSDQVCDCAHAVTSGSPHCVLQCISSLS